MLASTQSDSPEAVLDQGQSLISMTALFAFIVMHLAVSITEKTGDLQNDIVSSKSKSKRSIAVSDSPHHYGNSHAIWDHTVLPATRQR